MTIMTLWWFGILCLVFGLLTIAGGLFNCNWLMDNPKAERFVKQFGHSGARVFYCVLGLAFAGLGLFLVRVMEPPW